MTTTPLPTDPAARVQLYINRLAAVKNPTAAQSAELATYRTRLSAMTAPVSTQAPAVTPTSPPTKSQITGTPLQLQQGLGYGPSGEGTAVQQQLVNAGNQVWIGPGLTKPAVSSLQTSALAFAAAGGLGSAIGSADLASIQTAYAKDVGVTNARNAALAGASGVGTPVTAGNAGANSTPGSGAPLGVSGNASPYVPSLDNTPAYSVGTGAGQATGTGAWGSSGGGSSLTPYLLIGGAALAAYLVLGKKGRKLL